MGESVPASCGGGEPYGGWAAVLVAVPVGVAAASLPASPEAVVPPHAMAVVTMVAAPKTIAARVARECGAGMAALSVAPQNGQSASRT